MTRKKTLKDFTRDDLHHELTQRFTDQHFRRGMTMSEMELLIWQACGMENPAALRALNSMLARIPLEAPTGKLCPKCGMRVPVKAKDRERELRTMAGRVTLKRNYHYCETCQLGFHPLDRALELPEAGELTAEMEQRVPGRTVCTSNTTPAVTTNATPSHHATRLRSRPMSIDEAPATAVPTTASHWLRRDRGIETPPRTPSGTSRCSARRSPSCMANTAVARPKNPTFPSPTRH
jgi:hypothetical protein